MLKHCALFEKKVGPKWIIQFIYLLATKHSNMFMALIDFLAHLSRMLTRWAYSIPMDRRPSVVVRRRRPHVLT